jgi:hypothetical protein
VSESVARVGISRDTVGVRNHRPEHPGLSAQHRDVAGGVPAQRDRDREVSTILPGSCMAAGAATARAGPSSFASPLRRAVSTNSAPPACDTSDSPPAITDSQG